MKKIFLIVLKLFFAVILFTSVLLTILFFIYNEELPTGSSGPEADTLATNMLNALNNETYNKTNNISWTFVGKHHYKWNKKENIVIVSWGENVVELHTKDHQKSSVKKFDTTISSDERKALIHTARDYFNNDSFWLVAPFKVFDSGVQRSIVSLENNQKGLLITYTSGGSTPGDSYLWILDKNNRPISYKMWVSIIPIGGIQATWEKWELTSTGIKLPTMHHIMGMELAITNLKTWN